MKRKNFDRKNKQTIYFFKKICQDSKKIKVGNKRSKVKEIVNLPEIRMREKQRKR